MKKRDSGKADGHDACGGNGNDHGASHCILLTKQVSGVRRTVTSIGMRMV